jgi:hypothetical protein
MYRIRYWLMVAIVGSLSLSWPASGDGGDRYLTVVRGYADVMLAEGRDTCGSVQSALLASALDLQGPALLTSTPAAPSCGWRLSKDMK